jgi:hypothetical protein
VKENKYKTFKEININRPLDRIENYQDRTKYFIERLDHLKNSEYRVIFQKFRN